MRRAGARGGRSLAAAVLLCSSFFSVATAAPGEPIARETRSGPVTARVTVSPAAPLLGDPITLTLEVTAEPGVELHMPAFGEALGRFEVTGFEPRERRTTAGGTVASQRYTLEAPMSGRQTIPELLVEFVDRRPSTSAADREAIRELYTEEIPLEVASALPEGALASALRPARGPLDESAALAGPPSRAGFVAAAAVLGAGALASLALLIARARRRRARASAFDVAIGRLAALEAGGFPRAEAADAWYVALSDVVRRYIEDRFALRAPELTTEEFIREAGRSPDLNPAHRALLREFLERCDRVKFAAYRPGESESREALGAARRFLEETRLGAGAAAPGPVAPRAPAGNEARGPRPAGGRRARHVRAGGERGATEASAEGSALR